MAIDELRKGRSPRRVLSQEKLLRVRLRLTKTAIQSATAASVEIADTPKGYRPHIQPGS